LISSDLNRGTTLRMPLGISPARADGCAKAVLSAAKLTKTFPIFKRLQVWAAAWAANTRPSPRVDEYNTGYCTRPGTITADAATL
jgi:hypothetical protein